MSEMRRRLTSRFLSVTSNLTTCPICLETFDNPRSLPCLHSFCLQCIRDCWKDKCPCDEVACPMCRKELSIPSQGVIGLPHNFFIQGLIDEQKVTLRSSKEPSKAPCEVCLADKGGSRIRNVPRATNYCVNCEQKLCSSCSAPHRRWRGGGHQVKVLGPELEQELLRMRLECCDEHSDQPVELYCFTCHQNICLACSVAQHQTHQHGPIRAVASDFKSQINSHNDQMASRITKIQRQIEQRQANRNKLLADIEQCGADIKASGDAAHRLIDSQVRQRLQQLDSVKEMEMKTAAAADDRLQLDLLAAQSFHEYSCELLDKGRPSDITRAAAEIQTRATEILRNDVISGQYRAPNVIFAASDVNDMKTLDLIGQLDIGSALVHEFPPGGPVAGVTILSDEIFLLRPTDQHDIQVFDKTSYRLQRHVTLAPRPQRCTDITSCQYLQCLYIGDSGDRCVHKIDVHAGNVGIRWPVGDEPTGLSVTATSHHLLVTCRAGRTLKEFSSCGEIVRELILPCDVTNPWHAIQLADGSLLVCHGGRDDVIHRVVVMTADGQAVVQSSGGQKGSASGQYDAPIHLAVDSNESVFAVDANNRRVKWLSATLAQSRRVTTTDQLHCKPYRLCLDVAARRLYVTDNVLNSDNCSGRVLVLSV